MDLMETEKGKMTYKNGDEFEGGFKQGIKYGYGRQVYADGEVYEGKWHNNQRHDQEARITYPNGDVYVG